jgi:hypothetical protein
MDDFDERDLAVEGFRGQSDEHKVAILDVGVAHGVTLGAEDDMAGRDRERIWPNPCSVELKVNVTATYRRLISWWARGNRARC